MRMFNKSLCIPNKMHVYNPRTNIAQQVQCAANLHNNNCILVYFINYILFDYNL